MTPKISIGQVNCLDKAEFIEMFKNIVEYGDEIATKVEKDRPISSVQELVSSFTKQLDILKDEEKEDILKAHPELGTSSLLTKDSQEEQKSAGLDRVSSSIKDELMELNKNYREKFGIPFIICVKENTLSSILASMKTRMQNTKVKEVKISLEEVKKIVTIRIISFVSENS